MKNLQYKDIAVLTTPASELELYQELQSYQADTVISQGDIFRASKGCESKFILLNFME